MTEDITFSQKIVPTSSGKLRLQPVRRKLRSLSTAVGKQKTNSLVDSIAFYQGVHRRIQR